MLHAMFLLKLNQSGLVVICKKLSCKTGFMKKYLIFLTILTLSVTLSPASSSISATHTTEGPVSSPEAQKLISRLHEINELDKKQLNPTEKRELRKEVKSLKKQLRELSGGVYLSAGTIIIILLILIILL
jgi:hypothetical protein